MLASHHSFPQRNREDTKADTPPLPSEAEVAVPSSVVDEFAGLNVTREDALKACGVAIDRHFEKQQVQEALARFREANPSAAEERFSLSDAAQYLKDQGIDDQIISQVLKPYAAKAKVQQQRVAERIELGLPIDAEQCRVWAERSLNGEVDDFLRDLPTLMEQMASSADGISVESITIEIAPLPFDKWHWAPIRTGVVASLPFWGWAASEADSTVVGIINNHAAPRVNGVLRQLLFDPDIESSRSPAVKRLLQGIRDLGLEPVVTKCNGAELTVKAKMP